MGVSGFVRNNYDAKVQHVHIGVMFREGEEMAAQNIKYNFNIIIKYLSSLCHLTVFSCV